MEWSSLNGRGPRWFTVRKTDLALQRRDILTVSLVFCLFVCFVSFVFLNIFYRNFLRSSSTQFLVVLFFISFYTAPFSWKHFFSGFFVRCFSTQLFFLVVLLLLLLNMTAFSYVGLLSLFWVWLFHAVFLSHLPPISFLDGLSSEQFAELGSVQLLAFFSSGLYFSLPVFRVWVLSNFQGHFYILSSLGGRGGGGRGGRGGVLRLFFL